MLRFAMADDAKAKPLTQTLETEGERVVHLDGGRSLAVVEKNEQILELRAPSGQVELQIRITPEGPVVVAHAVALELAATERVSIACKEFAVQASQSASVTAGGAIALKSETDIEVSASDDVRVVGKKIHLN